MAALWPRRGLTDQDLQRITRAAEAARAPGTHKIYQYAWEQWASWCPERGFEPDPGRISVAQAAERLGVSVPRIHTITRLENLTGYHS